MAAPNFKNRTLYHGDNLDFLRGMNSETVHLIATDPPFKKGRDFHATPNSLAAGAKFQDRWSWRDDIQGDWLNDIIKEYPEVWNVIATAKTVYGDDMAAYLCWLGVRLLEMQRILRIDGSLYLHIDHTAHAYAKTLLDAIFGYKNFRNEIVWSYNKWTNAAKYFQRNHDILLFYSKGNKYTFNKQYWMTKHKAKVLSRGWDSNKVSGIRQLLVYDRKLAADEINKPKYDKVVYLDDKPKGTAVSDVWSDIPYLSSRASERVGYPTQKPLALYERIIKASSNEGDIVLDPFCGCATTPVAAERTGRQWVGMDLWAEAHKIILEQLEQEKLAVVEAEKAKQPHLITFGDVHYSQTAPVRTDRGESAAPVLETPTRRASRRYPPPRTQHDNLLIELGAYCQGCGNNYSFDPRVLEVDHVLPKTDGGTDAYANLTLLCPPCNKEKRDRLTLSGLQDQNRRNGYLKPENEGNISRGRMGKKRRRTRRRR